MSDFVRVASAADFADGEMRQVEADGTAVLLSRVDGAFHACTAFCTHYGAPLATGVLSGTTVFCPWHHAAFDVASGDLCEPPALDALRTFEVRLEGDDVLVRVPADADAHGKGVDYRESDGEKPAMAAVDPADDRLFLVLGAGAAGQACAEHLRHLGYRGRLVMATGETRAPYDRTKLSKGYLSGDAGDDALRLRDASFYEAHGIEVWTDRAVTALDPETKTASFDGREPVAYDAALVATGGTPNRLPVPGADLEGVDVLRSWDDAQRVIDRAEEGQSVAIVGGSFIGMESASSLRDRGLGVTVIDREDTPLQAALGPEVGGVFEAAARENGVAFRLGASVERIETVPGDPHAETPRRLRVVLEDGAPVEADFVLLGVGVRPATEFLEGAPFRRDDGGLVTSETLRVAPGLFAAGDVAAFPSSTSGRTVRIEHWRLAQQHARTAAQNMLAEGDPTLTPVPFEGVPYFWTGQHGVKLRYVGHAEDWDEVVVDGSLEDRAFVAGYVEGGAVRALAAVGRDRDAAAFNALLARGETVTAADVRAGADFQARL